MSKRPFARIGFFSDPHVGYWSGLTVRRWQLIPSEGAPDLRKYVAGFQLACINWFESALKPLRPFDKAIFVGDMTDGKGSRKSGVEVLLPDLDDQRDCAVELVNLIDAKVNRFVFGTNYHGTTTDGSDVESSIAEKVGAPRPKDFAFIQAEGTNTVFHVKHHIGASQREAAKFTAVAASHVQVALETEKGTYPKADVLIRAHRHQFSYCGRADWLGMVLPGLQGPTSFGGRRMDGGESDYGFVVFDVYKDGSYTWHPVLANFPALKYSAERI